MTSAQRVAGFGTDPVARVRRRGWISAAATRAAPGLGLVGTLIWRAAGSYAGHRTTRTRRRGWISATASADVARFTARIGALASDRYGLPVLDDAANLGCLALAGYLLRVLARHPVRVIALVAHLLRIVNIVIDVLAFDPVLVKRCIQEVIGAESSFVSRDAARAMVEHFPDIWDVTRREFTRDVFARQRVAPWAGRLLMAAAWILPAADRARYAEEWHSEVSEMAHTGKSRTGQLAHAFREAMASPRLCAELRAPLRRHGESG